MTSPLWFAAVMVCTVLATPLPGSDGSQLESSLLEEFSTPSTPVYNSLSTEALLDYLDDFFKVNIPATSKYCANETAKSRMDLYIRDDHHTLDCLVSMVEDSTAGQYYGELDISEAVQGMCQLQTSPADCWLDGLGSRLFQCQDRAHMAWHSTLSFLASATKDGTCAVSRAGHVSFPTPRAVKECLNSVSPTLWTCLSEFREDLTSKSLFTEIETLHQQSSRMKMDEVCRHNVQFIDCVSKALIACEDPAIDATVTAIMHQVFNALPCHVGDSYDECYSTFHCTGYKVPPSSPQIRSKRSFRDTVDLVWEYADEDNEYGY